MKEKPIAESLSVLMLFKSIVLRFICIAGIVSAIYNFHENYFVTSFAIVLFGFLFFMVNQPSIKVYKDRFIYLDGSLFKLFDKTEVYYFKEIDTISIDGLFTETFDVIDSAWNSVDIVFKDGSRKSISTRMYKSELQKSLLVILKEIRKSRSGK